MLLILDVFKGQTVPSALSKLKQANIDYLFVPPNCTDRLQPLDVAVNKTVKSYMKGRFIQWYAESVQAQLHSGKSIEEVKVDMKLSIMKTVTCNWIVGMMDYIKSKPDVIIHGFSHAGILGAMQ